MYNHVTFTVPEKLRHKALTMVHFVRRSLLAQLIGVYLVFVLIVIGSGIEIDAVGQRQIRAQFQTTDLSLAQEVAFDTYTTISETATSLVKIEWAVAGSANDPAGMQSMFDAFRAGRPDIDHLYFLDASGVLRASSPVNQHTLGLSYATLPLFHRVQTSDEPLVEGGTVDPTTSHDVVTVAEAIHGGHGQYLGMLATSLLLDSLSQPLGMVVAAQAQQGQHVTISMLDDRGLLIAGPDPAHDHLLQPFATHLPGAVDALAGSTATYETTSSGGNGEWLYSAVPVPAIGWAVVVQRPASDIAAATSNFGLWLLLATVLFGAGGLFFWVVLLRRVVRPLHALAERHNRLNPLAEAPTSSGRRTPSSPERATTGQRASTGRPYVLPARADEIGLLARSLQGLEREVVVQLAELRTLLETSNAVVNSLDPRAVGATIIREVRRLVDVQAAAVLVPDDSGALHPLVSEGRAENYETVVRVPPDDLSVPAARALHDHQPVQMIDDGKAPFPKVSRAEGFRAVLAIPIVSQRVGGVVLAVHRREPVPFTSNEVDLLLTFANYATLAWEHAVLYERSDERLREVARENERLYHEAMAEKRTLGAIVGSMRDGLLLTSPSGEVLYANPGARGLLGLTNEHDLDGLHIRAAHERLAALAEHPDEYRGNLARAEAGETAEWLLETRQEQGARALQLRLFDVRGEGGEAIGRGLLLRDVTREREMDQFKTTLLAAVGHELRTPLAAIKGHASTLLQDDVTWSQGDQRHFLSTISAEADNLAQLVSNLLDLSRIEAGLLELRRQPRRLDEIAASALRRHDVGAYTGRPSSAARIVVEVPDDLPPVRVDAARIEVVVHNLVSNALAYSDGMVRVGAEREADGRMLRVVVSDDGPGIAEEDLAHIFERFYRARHTRHQSGGTGLGLAICKAFVQAHGGRIWAESGPAGTSIYFTLPLAATPGQTEAVTSDSDAAPEVAVATTDHAAPPYTVAARPLDSSLAAVAPRPAPPPRAKNRSTTPRPRVRSTGVRGGRRSAR
ncbi:MAG TPA: ATP-binding protein [Ktedonobacterales bacterium]